MFVNSGLRTWRFIGGWLMLFYIDPGTGSMLFTILIGVLGAGIYILRDAMVKLRFLLSGGKRGRGDEGRSDFAFFTDSKRYWTIFKPICDEMEKRGADVQRVVGAFVRTRLEITAETDPPFRGDVLFSKSETHDVNP